MGLFVVLVDYFFVLSKYFRIRSHVVQKNGIMLYVENALVPISLVVSWFLLLSLKVLVRSVGPTKSMSHVGISSHDLVI